MRNQYRRRASRHQVYYRASGVVTVLLGVSLPLLVGLDFDQRDLVLSAVSIAVAALAGLREFYQWGEMWSLLRRTENALTDELLHWDLKTARASATADPTVAARERFAASEELLDAVRQIRDAEAERFFGGLRLPRAGRDGSPPERGTS